AMTKENSTKDESGKIRKNAWRNPRDFKKTFHVPSGVRPLLRVRARLAMLTGLSALVQSVDLGLVATILLNPRQPTFERTSSFDAQGPQAPRQNGKTAGRRGSLHQFASGDRFEILEE